MKGDGFSDADDFVLVVIKADDVSALELARFIEDGDAVEVPAGHFVDGVQACADGDCSAVVFFDFFAEVLEVVLVGNVQVDSVGGLFFFGNACFAVCDNAFSDPVDELRGGFSDLEDSFKIVFVQVCALHKKEVNHKLFKACPRITRGCLQRNC